MEVRADSDEFGFHNELVPRANLVVSLARLTLL
jgi:hypothetical protein